MVGKITFTRSMGKGPPPEGMTPRRWKRHGVNLRRVERLTGIAPIGVEGWEMVAVVLMNMLDGRKRKRRKRKARA